MPSKKLITVFEHEKLRLKSSPDFTKAAFEQLVRYYGTNGTPYFSLLHEGVRFNQYVGVIQVGNTTIEVLPKPDRARPDESRWRNVLINMLRSVTGIQASATSSSELKLSKNSIYDLYIELFIKECERLTRQGLARKYRKVQENQRALRGRLHIPGQIRDNLIHKERFNTEYSSYDYDHLINQVLRETLLVLMQLPIRFDLRSRVKRQLLLFDDISGQNITQHHLDSIHLNRKTQRYSQALEIARLILLNYHPDISRGANHVLALMFDMNQLWELFIAKMMKRHLGGRYEVKAQQSNVFWRSEITYKKLKPDIILISKDAAREKIIIDTKWKTPDRSGPSDHDLRQLFAYNHLFGSTRGILLYPGPDSSVSGQYQTPSGGSCAVVMTEVTDVAGNLRKGDYISEMLG
jgi:5-methylcytosine-specific restriction enzyme subunit McrC